MSGRHHGYEIAVDLPSSHSIEKADSPTRGGSTMSLFTCVSPDRSHSETSLGASTDVILRPQVYRFSTPVHIQRGIVIL
jgi:hypothetical protein